MKIPIHFIFMLIKWQNSSISLFVVKKDLETFLLMGMGKEIVYHVKLDLSKLIRNGTNIEERNMLSATGNFRFGV